MTIVEVIVFASTSTFHTKTHFIDSLISTEVSSPVLLLRLAHYVALERSVRVIVLAEQFDACVKKQILAHRRPDIER